MLTDLIIAATCPTTSWFIAVSVMSSTTELSPFVYVTCAFENDMPTVTSSPVASPGSIGDGGEEGLQLTISNGLALGQLRGGGRRSADH